MVAGRSIPGAVVVSLIAVAALEGKSMGETTKQSPVAYACIRLVRRRAGEPARAKIALPPGYELTRKPNHAVASPGEYYVFLKGPKGAAKDVRIDWPGVEIAAVVHDHDRLTLRRSGGAVSCDVPVRAASARAAWGTLAIWSHLDEQALPIRIEHNDPDRRAGRYARGEWVAGQAAACLHYLVACRQILRDWGLHRQIRSQKLGHLSLMGFESNNPLHGDWPAHWHLIYYFPATKTHAAYESPGSQVPHFYLDAEGRTVSNSIFVFGHRQRTRKAGPRDPMVFTDPNGKVRFAVDIREDGGVDLGPAAGTWTYAIVAGETKSGFTESVRVLRRGEPWIRVAVRDDTKRGVLTIRIEPLDAPGGALVETHRYDPLTGRRVGKASVVPPASTTDAPAMPAPTSRPRGQAVAAPGEATRYAVSFTFGEAAGIGRESGVCRRDPSDVIRVGRTCYVWYTRVRREDTQPGRHGYPSGYQGTVWYAASRDQGRTWTEKGQAVPKGPDGAFDCTATFTPNVLVWKGKYYLYYTAVGPGFDNGPYADRNRTAIGLAVADAPGGPWKKVSRRAVLATTRDPERFDSYRVDDACLLVRGGKVWMYYKGRQWRRTPGQTKMGVAVADRPEGPFRRLHDGRPVQDSGHEVLVWPHGEGVMSLVSATGPHGRTLQLADDGVHFRVVGRLPRSYPRAPGLFRPDLAETPARGKGVRWGICMAPGRDPYLRRFEIALTPP